MAGENMREFSDSGLPNRGSDRRALATMPVMISRMNFRIRKVLRDPFYRGSSILLTNAVISIILSFLFWVVAARDYSVETVGISSGLISSVSLISTFASLGLQNTVTRHLATSASPRKLIILATAVIMALGGALSAVIMLAVRQYLPNSLGMQLHGRAALLVSVLAVLTSLDGAWTAGLIVLRLPQAVLWTNLAGGVSRIIVLLLMTSQSSGLIIAFSAGLAVSALARVPPLLARVPRGSGVIGSSVVSRKNLTVTMNNYLATILSFLPTVLVPLIVLSELGGAQGAVFYVELSSIGLLNAIPLAGSQVAFAESSRKGAAVGAQARKAFRGIYFVLIPVLLIAVPGASLFLDFFGSSYSTAGSASLRILMLATLITSGSYLIDAMLVARDRSVSYLFVNGANAILVVGFVGVLVRRGGVTAAAEGWCLAQVISLLLGLVVLATGKAGRHRREGFAGSSQVWPSDGPGEDDSQFSQSLSPAFVVPALTSVPLMIGNMASVGDALLDHSAGLARYPQPARPRQRMAQPGDTIFFGVWFPDIALPVRPQQARSLGESPVLIAFSAYSGWLTAVLLPSLSSADITVSSWEVLCRFGGLPRYAAWDSDWMRPELSRFFGSLGVKVPSAAETENLIIRQMCSYIGHRFVSDAPVYSLAQFSAQLMAWAESDNAQPGNAGNDPPVVLAVLDRRRMVPLPQRPPAIAKPPAMP
jgi:O-antigen/teichoic acid export membrane protein